MSIIEGAQSHYRLFGPYGVFLITKARLSRRPAQIAVAFDGLSHPVHLRLRTTDVSLFEEILLREEYDFVPKQEPAVVVDAGANIGLTSVYFANRYPNARIFAIEPECANFEMLQRNAARYANIVPVHAALWKNDGTVSLNDPGSGSWGFQTGEVTDDTANDQRVSAITIDTLMRAHDLQFIDVLKVDIEGSEKEVFESCQSWIDRVGVLIVELHDRWKSGCSRSVYAATADFSHEWTHGETTFFVKSNYFRPHPRDDRTAQEALTLAAPRMKRARIVGVQS